MESAPSLAPPPLPPLPLGYTLDPQPQAPAGAPQITMPQPFRGPPAVPQAQTPDQADITHQTDIRLRDQNQHIDNDTLHMLAEKYVLDGTPPAFGMQSAVDRRNFWEAVHNLVNTRGQNGGDVAVAQARYRNGVSVLRSLETQLATISGSERTALANANVYSNTASGQPAETGYPIVNSVLRALGYHTGNPDVPATNEARNTFANEYARVVSSTPNGSGTLTDSAREQALAAFGPNLSPEQRAHTLEIMRLDMHNRIAALQGNITEGYRRLAMGEPVSVAPNGDIIDENGHLIPPAWLPPGMRPSAIPSASAVLPGPGGSAPGGPPNQPPAGPTPPGRGGLGGILDGVAGAPSAGGSPEFRMGQQMLSAPSGSDERFRLLEAYHNATAGHARLSVGTAGPNNTDPHVMVDGWGVSDADAPALEREYQMARRARAAVSQSSAEGDADPLNRMASLASPVFGLAQRAVSALGGDESAFTRGALDTVTLGTSDELQAGLNSAVGNGSYDDNVGVARAVAANDSQNHSLSRTAGQVAGGFALPAGEIGALSRLPSLARLSAVGAGYGAVYGAGSGEGGIDRLIRAGEGGASGAILAPAIGLAGRLPGYVRSFLPSRAGADVGAPGVSPQDLIAAADRQNIDVLPADVSGPGIRRVTSGMAQLPFASGPIIRGAQNVENQVGQRVADIATAEGAPARQEALGDTARTAAQRYIARSGAEGRRLYDAARTASGDATTSATGAMGAIDNHIAELSSTANTSAPEISALQRLRSDIADEVQPASQAPTGVLDAQGNPIMRATAESGGPRNMNIDALRRLRTNVRAMSMEEALRGTDFQRRASDVLSHLSDDIAQGLPPEAATAFRNADRQWADRLNVIDDVMSNVLGPRDQRSAEQVAQRLSQMSRSDSGRLKTFIDNATPEEGGIIRGSLIQELGRAPPGQQGAQGDRFSLSTFLTNWNRLPERSRNIMFRGDSRSAIEDLATVAEGSREAGKYANRSNTGGAVNTSDLIRGASVASAWGTTGASAILENLTGRLLASPRFARWLAQPPADPGTRLRRLAQIAAREPQLAADIIPIQRALETTVPRAAAQQEDDRR